MQCIHADDVAFYSENVKIYIKNDRMKIIRSFLFIIVWIKISEYILFTLVVPPYKNKRYYRNTGDQKNRNKPFIRCL